MPQWQVLHHLHPLDRGYEDRGFIHVSNHHQDTSRGERQGHGEGDGILHCHHEVVPALGLIIQALGGVEERSRGSAGGEAAGAGEAAR